jgi:uncharacterized LabA/DUF88 family protein
MDKAAVFIDGGYLARILKDEYSEAQVDFGALSERPCRDCELLRTHYYTCMPYQGNPPTADQRARYASMDRFIYSLKKIPRFEVRLGKLSYIQGEYVQKRVDVLLSVDLVRMSWGRQIQRAVLLSGDSDLVPAVQAAKEAGILTQVYYSERSVHDELLQACDDRFVITRELIESARMRSGKP